MSSTADAPTTPGGSPASATAAAAASSVSAAAAAAGGSNTKILSLVDLVVCRIYQHAFAEDPMRCEEPRVLVSAVTADMKDLRAACKDEADFPKWAGIMAAANSATGNRGGGGLVRFDVGSPTVQLSTKGVVFVEQMVPPSVRCAMTSVKRLVSALESTVRHVEQNLTPVVIPVSEVKDASVHQNFVWEYSTDVTPQWKTFPPGDALPVITPRNAGPHMIRSELLLFTRAARVKRDQYKHCKEYFDDAECARGAECFFIHAISVANLGPKWGRPKPLPDCVRNQPRSAPIPRSLIAAAVASTTAAAVAAAREEAEAAALLDPRSKLRAGGIGGLAVGGPAGTGAAALASKKQKLEASGGEDDDEEGGSAGAGGGGGGAAAAPSAVAAVAGKREDDGSPYFASIVDAVLARIYQRAASSKAKDCRAPVRFTTIVDELEKLRPMCYDAAALDKVNFVFEVCDAEVNINQKDGEISLTQRGQAHVEALIKDEAVRKAFTTHSKLLDALDGTFALRAHHNYVWNALSECTYERLFDSSRGKGPQSNNKNKHLEIVGNTNDAATGQAKLRVTVHDEGPQSDMLIPADLILKTRATRIPRHSYVHCAHYYKRESCEFGSICKYVHAVSLNKGHKWGKTKPLPAELDSGKTDNDDHIKFVVEPASAAAAAAAGGAAVTAPAARPSPVAAATAATAATTTMMLLSDEPARKAPVGAGLDLGSLLSGAGGGGGHVGSPPLLASSSNNSPSSLSQPSLSIGSNGFVPIIAPSQQQYSSAPSSIIAPPAVATIDNSSSKDKELRRFASAVLGEDLDDDDDDDVPLTLADKKRMQEKQRLKAAAAAAAQQQPQPQPQPQPQLQSIVAPIVAVVAPQRNYNNNNAAMIQQQLYDDEGDSSEDDDDYDDDEDYHRGGNSGGAAASAGAKGAAAKGGVAGGSAAAAAAAAAAADKRRGHVLRIYADLSECPHDLFDPSAVVHTAPSQLANNKTMQVEIDNGKTANVPRGLILKTGAVRIDRRLYKHCKDFFDEGVCHRGHKCKYVHMAFLAGLPVYGPFAKGLLAGGGGGNLGVSPPIVAASAVAPITAPAASSNSTAMTKQQQQQQHDDAVAAANAAGLSVGTGKDGKRRYDVGLVDAMLCRLYQRAVNSSGAADPTATVRANFVGDDLRELKPLTRDGHKFERLKELIHGAQERAQAYKGGADVALTAKGAQYVEERGLPRAVMLQVSRTVEDLVVVLAALNSKQGGEQQQQTMDLPAPRRQKDKAAAAAAIADQHEAAAPAAVAPAAPHGFSVAAGGGGAGLSIPAPNSKQPIGGGGAGGDLRFNSDFLFGGGVGGGNNNSGTNNMGQRGATTRSLSNSNLIIDDDADDNDMLNNLTPHKLKQHGLQPPFGGGAPVIAPAASSVAGSSSSGLQSPVDAYQTQLRHVEREKTRLLEELVRSKERSDYTEQELQILREKNQALVDEMGRLQTAVKQMQMQQGAGGGFGAMPLVGAGGAVVGGPQGAMAAMAMAAAAAAAAAQGGMNAFLADRPHQVDFAACGLPSHLDPGTLVTAPPHSPLREVAARLMRSSGSLLPRPQPVAGFTLESIDVLACDATGFEARVRRLDLARKSAARAAAPYLELQEAERLHLYIALTERFLPRGANAAPSSPNLVYVFQGTDLSKLSNVANGLLDASGTATTAGMIGSGINVSTNIEFAAKEATGEIDQSRPPARRRQDGCVPVVWAIAAVGAAYPVTRADDFRNVKMRTGWDCHVAAISESNGFSSPVSRKDQQYMLMSFEADTQILPLAVLWLKEL